MNWYMIGCLVHCSAQNLATNFASLYRCERVCGFAICMCVFVCVSSVNPILPSFCYIFIVRQARIACC